MHVVTDALPAYFITHACYGAFETIYPDMLALPVDNLDLAISNSALDLLRIFEKDPFTKDLSLGVLDVHSHTIEPVALVGERIMHGVRVQPVDRLWVDPDCGLKTRTVEEAIGKLKAMVTAVRQVREAVGDDSR
jgi:5-methyltetrahydropteroyltriglutamate--homocysteine methyltransferase